MEKVFLPQYGRIGKLKTLTKYSVGNKSHNVYLIDFGNEKIVHDEKEKGKLEFSSIDNIQNEITEIDSQINELIKKKELLINIINGNNEPKKVSQNEPKSEYNNAKLLVIKTPIGYVTRFEENEEGIILEIDGHPKKANKYENIETAKHVADRVKNFTHLPCEIEVYNPGKTYSKDANLDNSSFYLPISPISSILKMFVFPDKGFMF